VIRTLVTGTEKLWFKYGVIISGIISQMRVDPRLSSLLSEVEVGLFSLLESEQTTGPPMFATGGSYHTTLKVGR